MKKKNIFENSIWRFWHLFNWFWDSRFKIHEISFSFYQFTGHFKEKEISLNSNNSGKTFNMFWGDFEFWGQADSKTVPEFAFQLRYNGDI